MEICGLPCPPLDEEAFLPMTFDLFRFFDDIDDGGNKIEKRHTGGCGIGKQMEKLKQVLHPNQSCKTGGCGIGKQMEKLKQVLHPNQSCKTELNSNNTDPTPESKFSEKPNRIFSTSDVPLKLESAKRKLHQAYEQVENARKRKAIQVIDFQPISEQEKFPKKLKQELHPNQSCKTELNSNNTDPTSESKFSEKPNRIFCTSELKLEFAKRKLHQAYEQVENARKRKAIQVIDFQPISEPKKRSQKLRRGASSRKLAKKPWR